MNTTQLKSFAAEARKSLLSGVKSKMNALGFKDNGTVDERDYPMQASDGTLFQGEIYDVSFYGKWMRLKDEIARFGLRQVCEESAYTWFNRLVAIQILSRNGLIDPVLEFESPDVRIPLMVKQAHEGIRPEMPAFDAVRLNAIIDDDLRITDQFAILIVAYCQSTPILYKCFGTLNDFTELLLPTNILASNGFLSLLNGSTFITEDDYKTTELIGWLYQFYISERKDEVFASFKSGHKAEAEDIPAATQIFTPNWIVKYMVQNTLGRIYLDNNPDSSLKNNWEYLVDSPSERGQGGVLQLSSLEDYTFADLSCGSGHILNEAFDILFALYKEEGYNRRQAIKAIFEHNLTGVDIDTRARQLATFALMLKACQQWPDTINCEVMPRVYDMPSPDDPICERYPILKQANNLGSIMKLEALPNETHPLVLALTQKYAAIVMNPPYMGSGNMNVELVKYVRDNYEKGRADLCTVFMLMQAERTMKGGFYANIVPPSWMFLSAFEDLRRQIIDNQSIQSMLHLSRGVFGADFGSVSTVIQNKKDENSRGTYYRLVERTFQEFDQRHLKLLFEKALENHDFRYKFIDYTKDVADIVYSKEGAKIYYPSVLQSNFKKIPGCPIGYWLNDNWSKLFEQVIKLESKYEFKKGMSTGDNARFIKAWFEIAYSKIIFDCESQEQSLNCNLKWYPINCGGGYRKWYGNQDSVVNWLHDGDEMKENAIALNHGGHWSRYITSVDKFYREGLSWNAISSGNICVRYFGKGFLFCSASMCGFGDNLEIAIGLLNSKVAMNILGVLAPTLNYGPMQVKKIPLIQNKTDEIKSLVQSNISISKQDWDAHETSWDFQENELIRLLKKGLGTFRMGFENAEKTNFVSLELLVEEYKAYWNEQFYQLHENEEQLNRLFIEIYGLQDELSYKVPENEITILQQGEIDFIPAPGSESVKTRIWYDANIIQQFISYAIGCYMGRYRLDRPGLHIAHPNPTNEELEPYSLTEQLNNSQLFTIDDDGIIPLMPLDSGFPDCAATRISEFVELVFGQDNHAANMTYIEKTLGKDLESYFAKDFYVDHKKRYQNRPIYWLFSSPKGAFQVLVYMHRMTPFTVERIRSKYLLPYIERLTNKINEMNASILKLTSAQARTLQKMERDLQECREYHDLLHPVANQNIAINLDDGVMVNYAKFGTILAKLK